MYECPLFAQFWNATYMTPAATPALLLPIFGTEQTMDTGSIHFFSCCLSDASMYTLLSMLLSMRCSASKKSSQHHFRKNKTYYVKNVQ